jgi:hypothetical protein
MGHLSDTRLNIHNSVINSNTSEPHDFSPVGTYVIDVSVTDGLSSSGFATFNV